MRANTKKKLTVLFSTVCAAVLAASGASALGVTKAMADDPAPTAQTERALYFVDAGRMIGGGQSDDIDYEEAASREGWNSKFSWGVVGPAVSPFMTKYNLSYDNLLNSVSDKPFFAMPGDAANLSEFYDTEPNKWGFVLGDPTTGKPCTTAYGWGNWRIGKTSTVALGSETTRWTETAQDKVNGKVCSLMYKFEVPADTPVKVYFGTSNYKDWGARPGYQVRCNYLAAEDSNKAVLDGVIADSWADHVYDFGGKTFTGVAETLAGVEKNYITLEVGTDDKESCVSWILVTTANYTLDYTLEAPIQKGSTATTVKALPFLGNELVDVTLGAGAMDIVNAANDNTTVTIPVTRNGATCNVSAFVVPGGDLSTGYKTETNAGSGDNMSVLANWYNNAPHGGKDIYLVKGKTTVATATVTGGESKDKGLLMTIVKDGRANFTGGSAYGWNGGDWAGGLDVNTVGMKDVRTKGGLQISASFLPNTAARDEAYKSDVTQVGKATLKDGGVIDYVIETYAANTSNLLCKTIYKITIPEFNGDELAVKFAFDPQGSTLQSASVKYVEVNNTNYAVTFNSNGGTGVDNKTVRGTTKVAAPATNPTKKGYTFGGWYKEAACTTAFNFDAAITANTTVYAKWTAKEYTVTLDANGGSYTGGTLTFTYGSPIAGLPAGSALTPPAGEGVAFRGWCLFKDEGTAGHTHLQNGDTWTPENADALNVTLYAHWGTDFTVTFDLAGGTGEGCGPQTVSANGSATATATAPADPTRTGYNFLGWFAPGATTAFDFSTAITADMTLTAKWEGKSYTVTLDLQGGTYGGEMTLTFVYGNKIAGLPTAATLTAPADKVFRGWFTSAEMDTDHDHLVNGEVWEPADVNTLNVTLYAHWGDQYTVTFVLAGGDGNIPVQDVTPGNKAERPADPTRTGYTFEGWYEADSADAFDFDTAITENVRLTAKWAVNSYTVTFDANGGSTVAEATVNYNEKVTKPADPTRTGYTFAGWFTSDDAAYDFDSVVTGALTLTAKWTANSYTVTFNVNGGSTVAEVAVNYNEKVTKPADPTKADCTFGGWYKDEACTTAFDFATDTITADTTLYAKWAPASSGNDDGDNKPADEPKGCFSSISASLAIVGGMLAIGGTALVIKKKHDNK